MKIHEEPLEIDELNKKLDSYLSETPKKYQTVGTKGEGASKSEEVQLREKITQTLENLFENSPGMFQCALINQFTLKKQLLKEGDGRIP